MNFLFQSRSATSQLQPSPSDGDSNRAYDRRTADDYINMMDVTIREELTEMQLDAIHQVLEAAIPKPSPKIVDLRFGINLLISRFYVVIFVGKDRRQHQRTYIPSRIARLGNVIMAIALLIGINVLISLCIFLFAYLTKSAIGIDLFPDSHLNDQIQKL
jgi:hypothetical protein